MHENEIDSEHCEQHARSLFPPTFLPHITSRPEFGDVHSNADSVFREVINAKSHSGPIDANTEI